MLKDGGPNVRRIAHETAVFSSKSMGTSHSNTSWHGCTVDAINHCMGERGTALGGCRVAACSGLPAFDHPGPAGAHASQGRFRPDSQESPMRGIAGQLSGEGIQFDFEVGLGFLNAHSRRAETWRSRNGSHEGSVEVFDAGQIMRPIHAWRIGSNHCRAVSGFCRVLSRR